VSFNVRGRDPQAVANDIKQRLSAIKFPLEYRAEVLGQYQELQDSQRSLFLFGIAAVIGLFLLLQAGFGSWRLAALAFFTLPSALLGGVLAAFAASNVISLVSLMGFFAVFGIAARNCIMLINHYQHLERHEGEPLGPALVLRGAQERLGPILMTALAVGLALVPFAISGNIPGQEIMHPMAIVILGGLLTSTVLNLFIVPSLYLQFAPKRSQQQIVAGSALASMPPEQMAGTLHDGDSASSTKEQSGSASMTPDQTAGAQHNDDSASSTKEQSGSASMTPDQTVGAQHNDDSANSAQRRKPDAV
jgi:Cu/Ag efflux pump CusA